MILDSMVLDRMLEVVLMTGVLMVILWRYLDSVSKQVPSMSRPISGLTINEAIDRLTRARTLIGGDKLLIACLVGSELEDTDNVGIDVINDGESKYVEIAVRHPTFKKVNTLQEADILYQEIRRGKIEFDSLSK